MQGRGNFIPNAGKSSPCISHLKRALHCTLQGLKRNFQLIGFVQIFPDKDYSSRCSCKNKQQGAAINTLKSTQQKYAARAPKMPTSSKLWGLWGNLGSDQVISPHIVVNVDAGIHIYVGVDVDVDVDDRLLQSFTKDRFCAPVPSPPLL